MRTIKFDNIENFRDLGGYSCDYGETTSGVIYRSATLAHATEKDVKHMAKIGVKSVLDLREDAAREQFPDSVKDDPRFVYLSLPVNGNGRMPVNRKDRIYAYLEMLEDPYSARKIFQAIINLPKPMVIHCNAGKDRTGCFVMMLLWLAGVAEEDINADYIMSYALLPKMILDIRTHHPEVPEWFLTPDVDLIPSVMGLVKKHYGSLENYCEAIGLSDDEYRALQNLLGNQEKSCGAVIFRDGKTLVEHMAQGHYSIPKGHVEKEDANEHATARREYHEETGLDILSFYDGFRTDVVYSPRRGSIKRVVFFAAESSEGEGHPQESEVESLIWLSPADAVRILSHDTDRRVVTEASHFVYRDAENKE